jgi:hypothetical protein
LLTFIYFIKKKRIYIKYHKNKDNTSISKKIIEKMTYEKLKDHKKKGKNTIKKKKNISFTINVEDQNIVKYKNEILEIAKYRCY